MLSLYHAPRSPFSFKVRILAHELGLSGEIAFIATDPWTDEELRQLNPLCKVPILVLEDGQSSLYGSPVICAYLARFARTDTGATAELERWDALRLEALADGLSEAVIRRFVESRMEAPERQALILRQDAAIAAALNELERSSPALRCDGGRAAGIGSVATAASLTYLDFRSPDIEWRSGRELLGAWFENFARRPSIAAAQFLLSSSP